MFKVYNIKNVYCRRIALVLTLMFITVVAMVMFVYGCVTSSLKEACKAIRLEYYDYRRIFDNVVSQSKNLWRK